MKIKPQYIGGVLNVPNLADQLVARLHTLNCWLQYASGKASIGRKASLKSVLRILLEAGFSQDHINQFFRDVITRLRMEQHAKEHFIRCEMCSGSGVVMVATKDGQHPLEATPCPCRTKTP